MEILTLKRVGITVCHSDSYFAKGFFSGYNNLFSRDDILIKAFINLLKNKKCIALSLGKMYRVGLSQLEKILMSSLNLINSKRITLNDAISPSLDFKVIIIKAVRVEYINFRVILDSHSMLYHPVDSRAFLH